MISSKVKALVVIVALLFCMSLVTVGCKGQTQSGWVNTKSLPGETFKNHRNNSKRKTNPNIVYIGSSNDFSGANFGPGEVSFDLNGLR